MMLLRAFSVLHQPYAPPPGYLPFYYRKLLHRESFPACNPIHFSPLILIRCLFFFFFLIVRLQDRMLIVCRFFFFSFFF